MNDSTNPTNPTQLVILMDDAVYQHHPELAMALTKLDVMVKRFEDFDCRSDYAASLSMNHDDTRVIVDDSDTATTLPTGAPLTMALMALFYAKGWSVWDHEDGDYYNTPLSEPGTEVRVMINLPSLPSGFHAELPDVFFHSLPAAQEFAEILEAVDLEYQFQSRRISLSVSDWNEVYS